MDGTTGLPGKQPLGEAGLAANSKQSADTRRRVALIFWVMGFTLLLVASVIVHFHPAPWPLDLQATITLQHLSLPFWLDTAIVWASLVDNVLPSIISFSVCFVVLALIGVFVWRRGGSPIPWLVSAFFISLGAGAMNGLDGLIGLIVARPRPSSPLVHVYMPEAVHSFPSGHVENDVVFLGFLLYLSLSKPVSQWRFRWLFIPLQLYAVLNILLIGYSRVVEGSHWLTDVVGGYLAGALWLVLLIVVYHWALDRLTTWHAKRLLEQSTQIQ